VNQPPSPGWWIISGLVHGKCSMIWPS